MKSVKFDNFKFWCSDINLLFSRPKGYTMPTKSDNKKYEGLIKKDQLELKEEQRGFIKYYEDRMLAYKAPPLSKTLISALVNRYGRAVYSKKTVAISSGYSFFNKGTMLEKDGIELLSKYDSIEYNYNEIITENDYLMGKADVICPEHDKIIDLKVSWNVNSFLKARTDPISYKYWWQLQGYMELYNINHAEVVFLLLNTPQELIDTEKIKLLNNFMVGKIDRDKFDLDMENLDAALTYENIPLRKRIFKFKLERVPEIVKPVYERIDKSREWLTDFHKSLRRNILSVSSQDYLKNEENNTEFDAPKPLQID